MKHPIIIITTLFFSLQLTAQGDGYLDDFKQKWKNATAYTLELLESMPEEHFDFKPTEEQMSFGEQAIHMVGNMNWLSSAYLGGKKIEKPLRGQQYGKAETIEIMKEGFRLAAEAIENLKEEQLTEKVKFFAGPMRKRQILTLMNDHVTHHRGQAIVYARLKGVKPPKYRGW